MRSQATSWQIELHSQFKKLGVFTVLQVECDCVVRNV